MACMVAAVFLGGFAYVSIFAMPIAVVALGESFTCRLRVDISYGMYLYGFLVQQTLAALIPAGQNFWMFVGLALLGSMACGWLSFSLVEKPTRRRFGRKLESTPPPRCLLHKSPSCTLPPWFGRILGRRHSSCALGPISLSDGL